MFLQEYIKLRTEQLVELTHLELDRNIQYVSNPWNPNRAYKEGMIVYHGDISTTSINLGWWRANKDNGPSATFNISDWDPIGASSISGNISVRDSNGITEVVELLEFDSNFNITFENSTAKIEIDNNTLNGLWSETNNAIYYDDNVIIGDDTLIDQNSVLNVIGNQFLSGDLNISGDINNINIVDFFNEYNNHSHTIINESFNNYSTIFPDSKGQLSDVLITSISDGDFLKWDSSLNRWVNTQNVLSPHTLGSHTDVSLAVSDIPQNNQILLYNNTTELWENISLILNGNTGFTNAPFSHNHDIRYWTKAELQSTTGPIINWNNIFNTPNFSQISVISDLDDVDTSGVSGGDTLIYNSNTNSWEPGTPPSSSFSVINNSNTSGNYISAQDVVLTPDILNSLEFSAGNGIILKTDTDNNIIKIEVNVDNSSIIVNSDGSLSSGTQVSTNTYYQSEPPENASEGSFWYHSETGILYVRLCENGNCFWATPSIECCESTSFFYTDTCPPENENIKPGSLWYNNVTGKMAVYIQDENNQFIWATPSNDCCIEHGPYGISDDNGKFTYYPSLYDAMLAANELDSIQAFANYIETNPEHEIHINGDVNINFNGYTYIFQTNDDNVSSLDNMKNMFILTEDIVVNIYNGSLARMHEGQYYDSPENGNIFKFIVNDLINLNLFNIICYSEHTMISCEFLEDDEDVFINGNGQLITFTNRPEFYPMIFSYGDEQVSDFRDTVFTLSGDFNVLYSGIFIESDIFTEFELNNIKASITNIAPDSTAININGSFAINNSEIFSANRMISCETLDSKNSVFASFNDTDLLNIESPRIYNCLLFHGVNDESIENASTVNIDTQNRDERDYWFKNNIIYSLNGFTSQLYIESNNQDVGITFDNNLFFYNSSNDEPCILINNQCTLKVINNIIEKQNGDGFSISANEPVSIIMSGNYFELPIDNNNISNSLIDNSDNQNNIIKT